MKFKFINIYYLCIYCSLLFSETLLVPEQYSSIQRGINAASNGDTVLVNQGFYCENIVLTKSIVLASYAIYDDLDNWLIGESPNIDVANLNIRNTIIDGGSELCDEGNNSIPSGTPFDTIDVGSVLLLSKPPQEQECITPTVFGFTIQGGVGTHVLQHIAPDDQGNIISIVKRLGGGILTSGADPSINYNRIINNGYSSNRANGSQSGGAIYGETNGEDFDFLNFDLDDDEVDSRCNIEIFDISNNYFGNNYAEYGRTFSNRFFENTIDISGSILDVLNCNENEATNVWVNIENYTNIDYNNNESQLCNIEYSDIYVDPTINQDCFAQNCGTEDNPFKTISQALALILPSYDNQVTIHLQNGNYNSNSGEIFPIILQDFINIDGESKEGVVLDAEGQSRVIKIINSTSNKVNNATISGGQTNEISYFWKGGAGIEIHRSEPTLSNLIFTNNYTSTEGSAIALSYGTYEKPKLINIFIDESNIGLSAIYAYYANADFFNVKLLGNQIGKGIRMQQGSFPITFFDNCTIANFAESHDITLNTTLHIKNSTIVDNESIGFADYVTNSILRSDIAFSIPEILYGNYNYNNISLSPSVALDDLGIGNINTDPEFINSEGNNFSLENSSPCIDAGAPNPWDNDIDQTRNDIGATGGPFIKPNFTEYSFGDIGINGSETMFELFNFRDTPIIIDSLTFNTNNFFSNIETPIEVSSLMTVNIPIICSPQSNGELIDEMAIHSNQFEPALTIHLEATINNNNNILANNLSGTLESGVYEIVSDISVHSTDTLIIEPGTDFLFTGDYTMDVFGTLIAQGTENDSINFYSNCANDYGCWSGIQITEQGDNSILEYVKISNVKRDRGALYFINANSLISHSTISENRGHALFALGSSPILSNIAIINNYEAPFPLQSLLIYFEGSNPIIKNSTIAYNFSNTGSRVPISIVNSSPIFINTIIFNNGDLASQVIAQEYFGYVNPIAINCNIEGGVWYKYYGDIYNSNLDFIEWNDNGIGNIDNNPLFIDPNNGNFSLSEGSLCIDAGIDYFELGGDVLIDLSPIDYACDAPDIGAFEWAFDAQIGDLNSDNIIDIMDIVTLVNLALNGTENTGCNLPLNQIHLSNNQDLLYNIPENIYGFQLDIIGTTILEASGGEAEAANFSIVYNNSTILGFSLGNDPITQDCGILTSMILNGEAGGIENIIFSNQNGSIMDVNYGNGNQSCNILGDINGDETIDVLDIIELLNIILGN